jgi:aryl-alcohol dehydrogenase-like predicted oxidoreductase
MEYTRLGSSGLVVSRLALGAMTFGVGASPWQRVDAHEAAVMVGLALDAGVTLFNTAASYGGGMSEQYLSRALAAHRKEVVIATKVGGVTGSAVTDRGLSRRHVLAALEGSLRRLGTDYVDILTAHHFDPLTPLEETLDAFDTVVRQGKARYLGFGNWPGWLAAKAFGLQREHGWHRFCTSESYYSLVGRDIEHELIPCCRDAGIGITAWSPLAMGRLSGRYTREDPDGAEGRATRISTAPPVDPETLYAVLDVLRTIGAGCGATPAQVALAWLLRKDAVDTVLIGASTSGQLAENLGAVSVELSGDDLLRLDELTAPTLIYPAWLNRQLATLPGFLPAVRKGRV